MSAASIDYDTYNRRLSAWVRRFLDIKGISKAELGRRIGMEQSRLSRAINDEREFRPAEIDAIERAFGLRFMGDVLMTEPDQEPSEPTEVRLTNLEKRVKALEEARPEA
jgi:transcriptional regulator with XRE-family HTH domain